MNKKDKTVEAVSHTRVYLYKQENSILKYNLIFNLIIYLHGCKAIISNAFMQLA